MIQNTAIRIATGCLKSTSVEALRCEACLPSIENRIEKQTLEYFIRARYLTFENSIQSDILLKTDVLENLTFLGNKPHRYK